jgi:hypothetical protein
MAGNPLVDQGVLNRVRASLLFSNFSQLNITAPFLGKQAITLSLQGKTTTTMPTLTGTAQSPEPYMLITATAALLRSQNLAAAFKAQMETLSLLGPCTVKTDAVTLPNYVINNTCIDDVREMSFAGEEPGWVISFSGYYLINSSLWTGP